MRHDIRKILAVFVFALAMFGLTACGNAAKAEEVSYDRAQLQAVADTLLESWNGMSAADLESFLAADKEDIGAMIEYYSQYGSPIANFTADSLQEAFAGYASSMEDLGAYVSTDGYEEPVVKGKEITLVTRLKYENREANLSIVFNKRGAVQSVALDPKYSIGEILEKAGMNTILGMGTVFAVLIFISLVIYCFNFIPNIQAALMSSKKKEGEKEDVPVQVAAKKPRRKIRPASEAGSLVDDKELVAAITAAICAYAGTSSDGFVVRSIRRADASKWKNA